MGFDVDANGILNVSAEDKSTGNKNRITITNDTGRLTKEQIERMLKEAEEMKEHDKKMAARIEAKNKVRALYHHLTSTLMLHLTSYCSSNSLCFAVDFAQLEQYVYGLRSSLKEEQLKSKLSEEDRKTVEAEIERVLEWLQRNESAEQEDFENKLKEIEEVCSPIIQRAMAAGGGQAGGMPGMGGMGGMGGAGAEGGAGTGGAGPKVEEVD